MSSSAGKAGAFKDKEKPHDVRVSNITAAKGKCEVCWGCVSLVSPLTQLSLTPSEQV